MANDTDGIPGNAVMPGFPEASGLQVIPETKAVMTSFRVEMLKTTLDSLKSDPLGAKKNADRDFQTTVLEDGLAAKGLVVSGKI